ncbi:type II secretion system protein GspD [Lebetimonas sp. JS138]|uniref:type II secretion system protein GspD n=1 Tax=Lebetimonas sp. JS138 TaxID=990072 RepID=UPI000467E23D|nr:type II protein secretion system protein D [Lebetimonas sp. JS138]
MKKIFLFLIIAITLFATDCNKKLFTLHLKSPVKFSNIISDISSECNLNVVIIDKKAKDILNTDINYINIDNVSLKDFLNTLFDVKNLFYKIENNNIYISYYKTKTFKLDFVPNSITGVSNVNTTDNTVKTDYSFDFWQNLRNNLINILSNINGDYKKPVIDKNSGLITVTANKPQMDQIKKYLNDLSDRLHKEVLIDVKIYSVELSKSHQTGIDWSKLNIAMDASNIPLRAAYIGGSESVFNSATFNISGFLNFLAQNGNVNSISNPKIVTLNNQKALIRVGDTIYYKYANEITTNSNGNPTASYEINSTFVGVVLDITPQISDNGNIILSISPRISAFKNPGQLKDTKRDMPPDTKDNSLISVVRMKNNQTLVLGGLITDDSNVNVNGVPVLKEIPLVKYLFSSKDEITSRKELVFVITPHIIDLNTKKTLKDYGFKKLPGLEDLDVK